MVSRKLIFSSFLMLSAIATGTAVAEDLQFLFPELNNKRAAERPRVTAQNRARLATPARVPVKVDERLKIVTTSDIIAQLRRTPLNGVNVEVRNSGQLLRQVEEGGSYYIEKRDVDEPVRITTKAPKYYVE